MFKKENLCAFFLIAMLSACAPAGVYQARNAETSVPSVQTANKSERLGTQWGDEVSSHVHTVDLRRTTKEPIAKTQVLYADKNYRGRRVNSMSLVAGKVAFSVESDNAKLPLYRDAGHYYLTGKTGQPYRLVYRNSSDNTYEIVASVDGIDVLNGRQASQYSSGYVLKPKGVLTIEGFRKSNSAVASFIFSQPSDAYAANTMQAKLADNIGIIGTVVYQLYDPNKPRKQNNGGLQAFPADYDGSTGYAKPPQ